MFKKKRKQLNNKGLSLVEVIIAIVILAIAVAPTLRLFASSTSFNARSREQQRAITLAESVMESFKAYGMRDLCLQFGAGGGGAPFKGVSSDASTTRFVTSPSAPGAALLDAEDELNPGISDYTFRINGALQEGKKYDITIDVSKVSTNKVLKEKAINAYTDAVIQIPESFLTDAFVAISGKAADDLAAKPAPADMIAGGVMSIADVQVSSLKRVIDVIAVNTGSGDMVTLSVTYDYEGTYSYSYVTNSSGSKTVSGNLFTGTIQHDFDSPNGVYSLVAYDNSATIVASGGKLENIYLYYFPIYKDAVGVTNVNDIINVDGATLAGTDPLPVHITKQLATYYSLSSMPSYEAVYHVSVNGAGNLELEHNLNTCLSSDTTVIPVPVIPGFVSADTLQDGILEDKGVIYNVDVKVYKAGETDVLASYSGTMND